MKRYLVIMAALLLAVQPLFGQTNLVINPSFEIYSDCPTTLYQLNKATGWTSIGNVADPYCSACFCHECVNSSGSVQGTVPNSSDYWQYPKTGKGMVATVLWDTVYNRRYYLFGRLTQQLLPIRSYCVSFYVSLGEGSTHGIKEIGAYLDDGSIDTNHRCGQALSQYSPQVINTSDIIVDTGNWVKISGSFIATGKEKFITIGNFKTDAATTKARIPTNSYNAGFQDASGYLIDDVSVVETGTKANAGPDTHVGQGDSVFIGIPDLALDCTWTKLGSSTVIGTIPGIWVKPTVTTSYVVTMDLCGTITKDTVKVDVWKLGVNSINGQTQDYSLAPNPSKGVIVLHQQVSDDKVLGVIVSNALGAVVYSGSAIFKDKEAALNIDHLPAGFYTLSISDGPATCYLKLIKE